MNMSSISNSLAAINRILPAFACTLSISLLATSVNGQVSVEVNGNRSFVRIDVHALQAALDSLQTAEATQKDTVYLAPFAYFEISDTLNTSYVGTDQVIQSPVEIGMDATSGDGAGPGTLTLAENNLRIRFKDTSNSGGFPTNDWELTANQSANGGVNFFGIYDVDHATMPFLVESAAPDSALYIDGTGTVHAPYGVTFADGSLASGFPTSQPFGTMLFWDGDQWTSIAPGTEGQSLNFCNGQPQWGTCD